MIPRAQQFAEKLHAYTLPRQERANTRVKDLVDLLLLVRLELPELEILRLAVDATFGRRGTHPEPEQLPPPPPDWQDPFAALASECGLSATLADGFDEVAAIWRRLRDDDREIGTPE